MNSPFPPHDYSPPVSPGNGWKIATLVAVVVAIVAVVVTILAVAGVFGRGDDSADDTAADPASEVVQRTREIICLPYTYNYKTLDADHARAQAVVTGKAATYSNSAFSSIKQSLETRRAHTECRIGTLELERLGRNEASFNAELTIATISEELPPTSNTSRLSLQLQKVHNVWLMSDIIVD